MATKKIQITFANPSVSVFKHEYDIIEAVNYVNKHSILSTEHKARLDYYNTTKDGRMIFDLNFPSNEEEYFSDDNLSTRLHGIARYLCRVNPEYNKLKLSNETLLRVAPASFDSIDLMVAFGELLKKKDDASVKCVERIADILTGVTDEVDLDNVAFDLLFKDEERLKDVACKNGYLLQKRLVVLNKCPCCGKKPTVFYDREDYDIKKPAVTIRCRHCGAETKRYSPADYSSSTKIDIENMARNEWNAIVANAEKKPKEQ